MLYPKCNEARALLDLGGVWDFQTAGAESWPTEWSEAPLPEPIPMAVPASYNDQKDDRNLRAHYGWVVYQRAFTVPRTLRGERVVLRFAAVTHQAEVYLNGSLLGAHKGGFLPFEFEIGEKLRPGENLLTVAVDNRVNYGTLPVGNEGGIAFFGSDNPGIPSIELAKTRCKPQNRPNFDFFNYAGLTRPVRIYTTPKSYIADVTVRTDIQGADGVVEYEIEGVGEGDVKITLLDAVGNTVAERLGAQGRLTVPTAKFWEPGAAYLYTLHITFGDDVYDQPFGIRTVEVRGTQFLINGKPFFFKGFGKHEDSFFRGRGLDE